MRSLSALRASFAETLYPVSPAVRLRPRAVASAVALVLVVAGLQLLRLPGDASVNTVWAEDGTLFLHDARMDGGVQSLLHPYNGYVHLVPRLVAAIAAAFPLAAAAALLAVISALVVGVVTLFVFVAARGHIPSPWWRLGLCATLVFMPVAGFEMLDNGANLQWYLTAAALWALLWRPPGVAARIGQFAICFLAAASDPLAVLLLPLAGGRLVATRSLREHAPTLGLLAGLALQLAVGTAAPHSAAHPGLGLLGRLYAQRVLLPLVAGDRGGRSLFAHLGWVPAYLVAVALVALAAVWCARMWRRGAVWPLAAFALVSVLYYVVPVELRWDPAMAPGSGSPDALVIASRYMMLPLFALWSLAAVALGGGRFGMGGLAPRVRRVAATAVVAVAATICVLDFTQLHGLRDTAPRWDAQLAAAREACAGHPGANAEIGIAPRGWRLELPCAVVAPR